MIISKERKIQGISRYLEAKECANAFEFLSKFSPLLSQFLGHLYRDCRRNLRDPTSHFPPDTCRSHASFPRPSSGSATRGRYRRSVWPSVVVYCAWGCFVIFFEDRCGRQPSRARLRTRI